ncbi:PREDICTED: hydroxyacyl-thioester dehydratase type 2, mitochondrial [Dufourea novaeangliae]|uniref:hydroxyacyl-thioester dehydratase type 2, mitochondrial n=1 Tax=Dufourea novaeangliae TaxID=178035 RepID=UPI0007672254|nr:PREDICTED: hydroxyacyl-thioester dehydratase type 2, mitochondrial [Dufourea novaeangliae]
MFTSKVRLIKRTGKNTIGRYEFLKLLATEFKTTKSKEAKEQVLANLANFAYDPINYGYIRQLQIIDLFLYALSEDNVKLVRFASGGICNLCVGACDITNSRNGMKNIKTANEVSVFKTITGDDILNFANLTGDYNPVHTGSANNLVHGALLNGLVSGVIGTKLPGPGTILVQQNITYPKPCYAGDKIEIKVQIVSVRKIIKCVYTCIANGEKIVLKGDAKLIKNS